MKTRILTGLALLPDNLYFSGALGLLLLPLSVVPVQLIEEHHQRRHQVQVLIHPACLQDTFRDVPLVGGSLLKSIRA